MPPVITLQAFRGASTFSIILKGESQRKFRVRRQAIWLKSSHHAKTEESMLPGVLGRLILAGRTS